MYIFLSFQFHLMYNKIELLIVSNIFICSEKNNPQWAAYKLNENKYGQLNVR